MLVETPLEKNKEYQKIYAKRWFFFFRSDYRYRRLWFKELIQKLGISLAGKSVLDVGFGSGNLLFSLPLSTHLYGVEQAESAVAYAHIRAGQLGFRTYDFKSNSLGKKIPFQDGFFDYVFLVHVLEHLPNDHEIVLEIRRVLKLNGLFFLVLPVEKEGESPRHLRVYRTEDVQKLIHGTFDLIQEEGSYHHSRLMRPLVWIHNTLQVPVLGPICDTVHHLLLRFLPYSFGRVLDRLLERIGIEPAQKLYLCRRKIN